MAKKKSQIPEDKLLLYDKLVDSFPDIDRKGVTMPYTSVNGHMFSIMTKAGVLGLRLSKKGQKNFIEKYASGPFKNYGAVMKDYVTVPDDLLQMTDELVPYLQESYDYVRSLEPKPTKTKR